MNGTPKNLLDSALDYYDQLATTYYKQKQSQQDEPTSVKEKREQDLKDIRSHLQNQRARTCVIADIQAQLDSYRTEGRQATVGSRSEVEQKQKILLNEKHHPTEKLEKMMMAACRPKPSQRHSAHHIVAGKGWIKRTYQARVKMHLLGVRINDPDNGVWLPKTKKDLPLWSMPAALAHKQYHTNYYEEQVANRVISTRTEQQVRFQLQIIGQQLQENTFPVSRERSL